MLRSSAVTDERRPRAFARGRRPFRVRRRRRPVALGSGHGLRLGESVSMIRRPTVLLVALVASATVLGFATAAPAQGVEAPRAAATPTPAPARPPAEPSTAPDPSTAPEPSGAPEPMPRPSASGAPNLRAGALPFAISVPSAQPYTSFVRGATRQTGVIDLIRKDDQLYFDLRPDNFDKPYIICRRSRRRRRRRVRGPRLRAARRDLQARRQTRDVDHAQHALRRRQGERRRRIARGERRRLGASQATPIVAEEAGKSTSSSSRRSSYRTSRASAPISAGASSARRSRGCW